jgi:hypothetical protein
LHGDALVSMGVSYWERGHRERALELTQRGADVLQAAVRTGALDQSTLAVAYGNLANMHRQLGHQNEATRFVEIAEHLEGTTRQ